jgi:chemotaxis protein methyltransferase CheR
MQALAVENWATETDQLSNRDFEQLSALVGQQVGIKLPAGKRTMVEGRLRKRVRALGCANLTEYCRYLFSEDGFDSELVHLIDVITTNKTDFFREIEHFECLEQVIVPELLAARAGTGVPRLKIWSAASSNGAEAYSIAMLLDHLRQRPMNLQFAVLGTDISTDVLRQGAKAVYSEDMAAPIPPAMQRRYLMWSRSSAERRQFRIVPELRRMVRFERLNLLDRSYPIDHDVDVIFLRNVLIYFDRENQQAVVRRLTRHLRPGGYIILGHSESMIAANMGLRQVMPSIFQNVSSR